MSQADQKSSSGCLFGALVAIGLLILIPSGLCTGLVVSSSIDAWAVALMFGGPFIVVGAGMTLIGMAGLRKVNQETKQDPPQDSAGPKPPY